MFRDKALKPRQSVQTARTFEPDVATFERTFGLVKAKIFSGELRKAVPFVVWKSPGGPSEAEIAKWRKRAFSRADLGKPYMFQNGESGSIGVTPELLFELNPGERWLRTVALAGTVLDPAEWGPKLKEEHELVIEGLLERLEGTGRVEQGPFEFVKYGTLWHGRTEFYSRDIGDETLLAPEAWVKRLHPTAAIGVLPLGGPEALAFLGERRNFGAPFLEHSGDRIFAWVQIRGLEWDASEVRVTCGVGVTAESEFEAEKAEAFAKFKNVAAVLGLSDA